MASEGVLWLDCTIRQQLSCSVPQDGKASRGNQESLGGKRQRQFCLKDVIVASLPARARHICFLTVWSPERAKIMALSLPVALSLALLTLSDLLETGRHFQKPTLEPAQRQQTASFPALPPLGSLPDL